MAKKKPPMANKKKIAKYVKHEQKITQKNHDDLQFAYKKYQSKIDWKLDFILKSHPSLIYRQLKMINQKLDNLNKKK